MKLLDSVQPEEVPEEAMTPRGTNGIWTGLAARAISDWQVGKVTVVQLADDAEYKKLRNGTADYFRKRKFKPTMRRHTKAAGQLLVYITLEQTEPPINVTRKPPTPEQAPVRRISVGNRSNNTTTKR